MGSTVLKLMQERRLDMPLSGCEICRFLQGGAYCKYTYPQIDGIGQCLSHQKPAVERGSFLVAR